MTTASRRAFLASAGGAGLAAVGGAGAAVTAAHANAGREMVLLRTYVARAGQYGQGALEDLEEGSPVRLMREPANDYDARAVAVHTLDGRKLGYVPRIDNQALANLMDAGLQPHARVSHLKTRRVHSEIGMEVSLSIA